MNSFVSRNPVLAFIILTLGFQLGIVLMAWAMLPKGIALHEVPDAHMLFRFRVFGPLVFATAITYRLEGGPGIRRLFGSFLHWRVPLPWYALAFSWKFLFTWSGILAVSLMGLAEWPGWFTHHWGMALLKNLPFVVGIAVVEETAWMKFSVTRLQARYSAFRSCLTVGLCWGCWYLPMMILGEGVPDGIPWYAFLLGMFSLTVMLGWTYNMTHSGMVLLVMQIVSNCAFFIVPVLPGWAPGPIFVTAFVVVFFLVAVFLLARYGAKELGVGPRARWEGPVLSPVAQVIRPGGAA